MRKNSGDNLLVDGTGVANYPHSGVGPSENGTNHSHLYFQSMMSFPCVLTNPLHQHLSHGGEGVQLVRERERALEIDIHTHTHILYVYIYIYFILSSAEYSENAYISTTYADNIL